MANPLDPADLYQRYKAAQASRGLGDLFQEEGPGIGPSSKLSEIISGLRDVGKGQIKFGMDPRIAGPATERRIFEESQDESLRRIKELAPRGLDEAYEQIKRLQKGPMFASPEDEMSDLRKQQVRKAEAERIDPTRMVDPFGNLPMPMGVGPNELSPLDVIAEQLNKVASDNGAGDEAAAQAVIADEAKAQTAEDFRSEEEKIADMQGMPVDGGMDSEKVLEDTFSGAMEDFISSVRGASPDKRERSIEEYKKEFAEATGIDISGKVDKSQALMAMGLALMQNRAGKGFNVGRILSAVGQAGESALPMLQQAKESARANAIAAGKYALETRASDRAKDEATAEANKKRGKYWVYKKGGKGTEFANFDEGEFVDLNQTELNKLIENKDFEDQYEFIDASDRMAILEKRAEGVDLGDMWGSYERISLIGGKADEVPPELQVLAAPADANYGGLTPTAFKIAEKPEAVARRFSEYQLGINRSAAKMEELVDLMQKGVTIPNQIFDSVGTFARNLGIPVGDGPMDVTKARTLLKEIAVREATNILQESGKTLSDQDRQRVQDLVGEINFASGDKELLLSKIQRIYDLTVTKPQENLDRAVSWLEQNAGIKFGPAQGDMPTEDELKLINESRKSRGEQPLTMDDYK